MPTNLQSIFPSFEPKLVESIVNCGEERNYRPEEFLVRTGQYFRSVLLVVDGLIKVYREDEEGNEFFIYYLQPGQGCALSMKCPVRTEKSQVMARAVTATTVITIPMENMDRWMHEFRSWHYFVLDTYHKRMDELLETIDQIAFRNMDERLLNYIQREHQVHNSALLTINNTEVAEELNSSREVISRLMKKLSEKGKIRLLKNHQVEIIGFG